MDEFAKAPLWQKVLAVVVLAGLLSWGYYTYLFVPKVREIKSLKNTLDTVEMEIDLITPKDTVIKDGLDIKEIIRKEIEELMKKIPTEQEVPFIIDELISSVGNGLNIDYRLIQPQPIVSEGKYKRLPLKVSFVSDYTEINLYLKQLKNLPATIRVDRFSLDKTLAAPKLMTNMELSIFIMPVAQPEIKEDAPVVRKPYLFDPFFKPSEVAVGENNKSKFSLELLGIWKGKALKAVINNKTMTVGDSISGYELIEIRSDEVILLKDGRKFTLKIK